MSTNPDDYEGQSVLIIGRGVTEIKCLLKNYVYQLRC